jgi:hypothetical protein
VQRTTALAATFLRRFFHAHPVPARGALRIQTLHGPSWKLHFASRPVKLGAAAKKGNLHGASPEKNNAPVKLAGFCADASSVSRKMSAISCGPLPTRISPQNWTASKEDLQIYGSFLGVRAVLLHESL